MEAVAGIEKQVLGRTGDKGTGAACVVTHRGRHICRPGSLEVVPAHLCSPVGLLPVTPSGFLCGGSLLRTLVVGIPQPIRNAQTKEVAHLGAKPWPESQTIWFLGLSDQEQIALLCALVSPSGNRNSGRSSEGTEA